MLCMPDSHLAMLENRPVNAEKRERERQRKELKPFFRGWCNGMSSLGLLRLDSSAIWNHWQSRTAELFQNSSFKFI